ncbi:aspartate kinase [Mongoliitalea daihaiensis]|uniref:aspartate kinase n=1 Tax=Mongoliitalea daihaiensis TaxID=2782006 RepID=UPI001F27C499|nr:aspartate kinase [Mongoliitalea daihaiensis]UJP66660.1 aspartate kinase [Mongoliitalea daihaiensis]
MSKTFVFKFGGASVKDAGSIKNLSEILFNRLRNGLVIVISAMGKTTNRLEEILQIKYRQEDYSSNITILKEFHLEICRQLFEENSSIFPIVSNLITQLEKQLERSLTKENYDYFYDQVVCYGELLSSKILQEYLCSKGYICVWQDAREIIQTDSNHRFAKVNWDQTTANCQKQLAPKLKQFPVIVPGFIGSTVTGDSTTLGREGSDFSAAILASCLHAQSVTIWKDVPGVLNADPKRFSDTVKFEELDYHEAAELTYYGASVIHPKTIKPLANAGIPLFVKSFLQPTESGTKIHHMDYINEKIPCIVVKDDQSLLSFKVTDFTFINEGHIQEIYQGLNELKLKVNLLQTSAISISIVVDRQDFKIEKLIANLQDAFQIRFNEHLQLITIKHHNPITIEKIIKGKEVIMEQITRTTFQVLHKPASS